LDGLNYDHLKDLTAIFYSFLTLAPRPDPWTPPPTGWVPDKLYETMTLADIVDVMSEPPPGDNYGWFRTKIQKLQKYCLDNGKKFIWAIGGWSDLTQTIADDQIPLLVSKIVKLLKLGGAHGVDFDWEHVSEHNGQMLQQQRLIIGKTICALRIALNEAQLYDMDIVYTPRYNAFWNGGAYKSFPQRTDGEGLDVYGYLKQSCTAGGGVHSFRLDLCIFTSRGFSLVQF